MLVVTVRSVGRYVGHVFDDFYHRFFYHGHYLEFALATFAVEMTAIVPTRTVPVSAYADGAHAVAGHKSLPVADTVVPPTLCQFLAWQCVPLVVL